MKSQLKQFAFAICAIAAISGCSKQDPVNAQSAPAAPPAVENTGPVVFTPTFQVAQKYSSYVRQDASEATDSEFQKLPDSVLDNYDNIWIKQAASIAAPDWNILAGIVHPQINSETNVFKKQEVADKVKTEVQPDKNSLNVVLGMQGKVIDLGKPDVATGEYHLALYPNEAETFTYAKKTLYYSPDFGCNHCNNIMMVKSLSHSKITKSNQKGINNK